MTEAVIIGSIVAGLATIVFAFIALYRDAPIGKQIERTVRRLSEQAEAASELGPRQGQTLAETTTQQSSVLTGGSEFVRALGELAGNLSKVSQAVAALVLATLFFAIAATVATIDDVDSSDEPDKELTSSESPASGANRDKSDANRNEPSKDTTSSG
ncbi:MAG TPA: hypothetical protein VNM89_04540 [Solirubrobacterales bacterium]|nr:hypothetical protein [Solirubrobacterales bacterium]